MNEEFDDTEFTDPGDAAWRDLFPPGFSLEGEQFRLSLRAGRPLADFECEHGRLPHDGSPACGCFPDEGGNMLEDLAPNQVPCRISGCPNPAPRFGRYANRCEDHREAPVRVFEPGNGSNGPGDEDEARQALTAPSPDDLEAEEEVEDWTESELVQAAVSVERAMLQVHGWTERLDEAKRELVDLVHRTPEDWKLEKEIRHADEGDGPERASGRAD